MSYSVFSPFYLSAASAQNQDENLTRYNGYVERYDATKAKVEALERERTLRLVHADAFDAFIRTARDMGTVPAEFDDKLWLKTVDTVMVRSDGILVFILMTRRPNHLGFVL